MKNKLFLTGTLFVILFSAFSASAAYWDNSGYQDNYRYQGYQNSGCQPYYSYYSYFECGNFSFPQNSCQTSSPYDTYNYSYYPYDPSYYENSGNYGYNYYPNSGPYYPYGSNYNYNNYNNSSPYYYQSPAQSRYTNPPPASWNNSRPQNNSVNRYLNPPRARWNN